jgi:hypothetical protein
VLHAVVSQGHSSMESQEWLVIPGLLKKSCAPRSYSERLLKKDSVPWSYWEWLL